MDVAILIDYDNLTNLQKISGILDIATKILMQLPKNISEVRGKCDIRVYGGWYEEMEMTVQAQHLTASIQDEFPTIIRVPMGIGNTLNLTANAELARALVEDPSYLLFNTYRKKGKPSNIRVQKPEEVGCSINECSLLIAQKLLKSGKCSAPGCTISRTDLIYRGEQKIVDTLLACDLLYYSKQSYDHIMIVSGDDDFLPPIRSALLYGSRIYRVHPTTSNRRVSVRIAGSQLVELEL